MPSSRERQDAKATYPSEWLTVGDHITGNPADQNPINLTKPAPATHLKLQALTQNIRYTVDGVTNPTTSSGFQLAAATDVLIPCPNALIIIVAEVANGSYEAQWVY